MTPCAIQLPLAIQPIAARSLRSSTNGQARCSLRMETKAVNSMRGARLCSVTLSAAVC